MRLMVNLLLAAGLFVCSGCDGNGSAQGSGTSNRAAAHARIGLPF
jgi:hypothetical protein